MPYALKEKDSKYCVVKKATGKQLKCYDSKKDALKYLAALEINVEDAHGYEPPDLECEKCGEKYSNEDAQDALVTTYDGELVCWQCYKKYFDDEGKEKSYKPSEGSYIWEEFQKAVNQYGKCSGCGYEFKDGDENKFKCPSCSKEVSLFQPGLKSLSNKLIKRFMNRKAQRAVETGLVRVATIDRAKIDEKNRTFEIALSSEAPVSRGYYIEVLSHSKGDVDMSRINDGTHPFLVNHNQNDQVGVIESARLDSDKVLRAIVRMGKSERANEIFQDIVDGIRKNISVGYEHLSEISSTRNTDGEEVVVFRWLPYEASTVPIPADSSVGVGRGKDRHNSMDYYCDGCGSFMEIEDSHHKTKTGVLCDKCFGSGAHSMTNHDAIARIIAFIKARKKKYAKREEGNPSKGAKPTVGSKDEPAGNVPGEGQVEHDYEDLALEHLEELFGMDLDSDNEVGESEEHKALVEKSKLAKVMRGELRGWKCPECGESSPASYWNDDDDQAGAATCPKCGKSSPTDDIEYVDETSGHSGESPVHRDMCKKCYMMYSPGDSACPQCGTPTQAKVDQTKSECCQKHRCVCGEIIVAGSKRCNYCGVKLE